MEVINCKICGGKNFNKFINVHDRLNNNSNDLYRIVKCECNFVYLNPRPRQEDINKYYKTNSYDPHRKKNISFIDLAYSIVQYLANYQKFNRIKKNCSVGNRLLDIGSGKGEFGQFMNNKGWIVTLYDSIAEYKGKLKFHDNLFDIEVDRRFNVITLWHVLEHLHNVNDNLRKINLLLDDSGILIIAVPNIHAYERDYYGSDWAPYESPRHLYHFDDYTLEKILEKNGFVIINDYSMLQDTPYNILLSINRYSIKEIIKAIYVTLITWFKSIINGPENASTLMVVCRKK